MLNQKRSGSLARLKYLVTVPVCAGLLCISTLAFSKTYGWVVLTPKKLPVITTAQKVKTLKSTGGDVVGYGDKMIIHGKTYTVDNLTDADKAFLQKNYKIKLEVVEIKGKPGQASLFFPSTGSKDTNNNSATVTTTYTSKGYKFSETGYLINGKSNFRVVITEKNGEEKAYFRNSVTPAQVKLLKDKYGYAFPTMPIYPKLPPPPPMPPANGKALAPPPHPASVKTTSLSLKQPPTLIIPDKDVPKKPTQIKSPPPPPPMRPHMPLPDAFSAMEKYIAKYVRYPAVARNNKVMGSVVVQFDLNADHKIANVALIKGIGSSCDDEALRVLNNFTDPVDVKTGTYKIAITFAIDGMNMPKPASEGLSSDPSFIGEVVVVTYL